jgi:hypothetical protein
MVYIIKNYKTLKINLESFSLWNYGFLVFNKVKFKRQKSPIQYVINQ